MTQRPSIVAPGGSLDKALVALHYGADAVYVGSDQFSLRKSAHNLNRVQLNHLCRIAHGMKKKVYLALNIQAHHRDMAALTRFLTDISSIPLDACIVSDLGILTRVLDHTPFNVHVSTQASVLNTPAVTLWQSLGATRVVLARENSLEEAAAIKADTGMAIEVFIHGAMCSSFSGKCTISNVTSGRDANRGGCVQSCRHAYELDNGDTHYTMNSKDLMGIEHIPMMIQYGIDAVKIEGRMKSIFYVANACQAYQRALDAFINTPDDWDNACQHGSNQLSTASNRGFTDASLVQPADGASISYDWNGYSNSLEFLGFVKHAGSDRCLLETKQPINVTDTVMVMTPESIHPTPITLAFESLSGQRMEQATPHQHVWLHHPLPYGSILLK